MCKERLFNLRKNKLTILREQGNPFPNDFRKNIISNQLHTRYGHHNNQILKQLNINVSLAGRMMTRRIMGKASFLTLQDEGGQIQLYVSSNHLSKTLYKQIIKIWDLGDILGINGYLFKTRTGELSVQCTQLRLLTKSLRPLPDKFYGLVDKEIRYRQRYLDLITNDNCMYLFKIRSSIIAEIRTFMKKYNFMEVETPMMHSIPGGATARPFITHHHTLDIDLYLRIAPELYLKRLVIGGLERIFEINYNFRNEGLSAYHNPEFTMMELYMAYADYRDLIPLIEELFREITQHIFGNQIISYNNHNLDFSKTFLEMTMIEAICYYNKNILLNDLNNIVQVKTLAKSLGIHIDQMWGLGKLQTEIFEETTKKHLIQPTFITAYPVEVSPLARRNNHNPFVTDRFELFIGGIEIGNGFSELNDPEDQASRFLEQTKNTNNNTNNIYYDQEYITALEYGLPPTAGLGIGIDRIIMLLTNSKNIRDVILFPTMRPQYTKN
ncbi:lysine--tRNA ligase [Candidatus Palibaumannia cicadellinicola]|nr:lysine--tRNA ligase [Candidatus Baumannia cicadellinicola]